MIHEKPKRNWLFLGHMVFVAFVIFIVTVLTTAAAVRHSLVSGVGFSDRQNYWINEISKFPYQVRTAVYELASYILDKPSALLIMRSNTNTAYHSSNFPESSDPGYLLLPAVDSGYKRAIIKLIRIADGKIIWQWIPNWDAIHDGISEKLTFVPKGSINRYMAQHPLILGNGDLIFNTNNSLIRLEKCGGNIRWLLNYPYHHSNELSADQKSLWVNSISEDYFDFNPWIKKHIRDDSIANVSLDGSLISNNSFSEILISNDLTALLLGTSGVSFNVDPIHLNQIVEASQDGNYWKRGDLLISARHLSTIFIYRPSTKKVVWYKQGPWMNQHSVGFLDNRRIYVFNNNVFGGIPSTELFLKINDTNKIMVYDFSSGLISEPFKQSLASLKPKTITEGRAQILSDGGLFFEETNNGRIFRTTKDDKLLWSLVIDYDKDNISKISWSRYYNQSEISPLLENFVDACQKL